MDTHRHGWEGGPASRRAASFFVGSALAPTSCVRSGQGPTLQESASPLFARRPAGTRARLMDFIRGRRRSSVAKKVWLGLIIGVAAVAQAAEPREVVLDFEGAEIGKPVPAWTEQGVVFSLAGPLQHSKAKGRVMFFPYLPTERKGILNAMAHEQQVPLQAKFPTPVSSVTLVLWGSTGTPAKLQVFDAAGRVVAEAGVPSVPGRKDPAEPVPQFELTVKAAEIVEIQLSGPRTGEFLAIDELRFVPSGAK